MVGPKREKLREAEASLAEANRKLAEKQALLKNVIDRVEGLQKQLSTAQQEQKDLNDQVRDWKMEICDDKWLLVHYIKFIFSWPHCIAFLRFALV